jgi:RimK family alpha-L-glutamate ligase
MNGIIIVNQNIGHNKYKIERFIDEFDKKNIKLDVFVNDGTLAIIKDNNVIINLPKADFVFYLDKDIYLARLLEKAGYRLFNRADFIKFCDDKMLTFIGCANEGIKMPKTIAGPLVYTDLEESNYKFLDNVINELGLPMVVKKVYGSLGEGIYLVNTKEELKKLYSEIARNPIVFQEYVKSSYGQSVRVLIIDGKVFGSFIRSNDSDFRSNYGDTASSKKLEKSQKYMEFAQKIADKLHIEYAGIDLFVCDEQEPILCEINSNAFFEEFEKVTGLNVAEAVRDMVIRKVNNNE